MRHVITTLATLEVPADYSAQIEDLLTKIDDPRAPGEVLRETYSRDEIGQKDYFTRLVTYPAPGTGKAVYAVEYSDPNAREVEESPDRAEVEAQYEELVRSSAGLLSDDERFDYTDVAGVPAKTVVTGP